MKRKAIWLAALALAAAVWKLDAADDALVIEDFAKLEGWAISYDAASYYKGAGARDALKLASGKEPGANALEATVAFCDASRGETAYISKSFGSVDISRFDVLTFWFKLSSNDIDVKRGVMLRMRDAVLPFEQWTVIGGKDVKPNEWQLATINLHERHPRWKFDDTKLARMSFIVNDDDYTNVKLTLTIGPLTLRVDPTIRAQYKRKPLVYTPNARPLAWDGSLDALVIRYGGECHYNIAKALRSLPIKATVREECYRTSNFMITHRADALADLRRYDLIVLAGVHAKAFDRAEQERLCDFVASGGGLIVVGGLRGAYGCGEYNASLLKLMLPVQVSDAKKDTVGKTMRVRLGAAHPVTAGLPAKGLKWVRIVHKVTPKPQSVVVLTADDMPLVIVGAYGKGRVVSVAAAPYCYYRTSDSFFHSDYYDDLMRQAALWAAQRKPRASIVNFTPPAARLRPGEQAKMSVTAASAEQVRLRLRIRKAGQIVREQTQPVAAQASKPIEFAYDVGPGFDAKGDYAFEVAVVCADGSVAALRDGAFEVLPALRVEPYIVHLKDVTAPGYSLDFAARTRNETSADVKVNLAATIVDAAGRKLHAFAAASLAVERGKSAEKVFHYDVPRLANGQYEFVVTLSQDGRTVDRSAQTFYVGCELDKKNFFQILLYQHMGSWPPITDWDQEKRELDDAFAHGYNSIGSTCRGAWKPSYWIELRNQAESYAQRKGMAIAYACNSLVKMSARKLPKICPNSPDYVPDIEKFLGPKLEEHLKVPRLHDTMTCDELAIIPAFLCHCEHCQKAFKQRYGRELPKSMARIKDPAQRAQFIEFYEDFWDKAWKISYDFMKKDRPNFMISNTFTSSVCGSRRPDVCFGDLFKWAAHYDYIFGDIYPYSHPGQTERLFRDFRCANAFLRCVAQHYRIPHAYWIENCVANPRAPRQAIRRSAYVALGQGAKGLLGWAAYFPAGRLPQDNPEMWEDMGRTFNDIQKIGPLLLKSRKRSRVGLVYSYTDWLFTKTYGGPYVRLVWTYDALGRLFGGADILYERQVAKSEFAGHQALVLTDVGHFSARAANALVEFVNKGGAVVCDLLPTLDERDAKLDTLEALFGVKKLEAVSAIKTLKMARALPLFPAGSATQVVVGNVAYEPQPGAEVLATFAEDGKPAVVCRRVGKGMAYILGFSLTSTYRQACEREFAARNEQLSRLVRGLLAEAGVRPLVRSSLPEVEANYLDGSGSFTIIAFNHSDAAKQPAITARDLPFTPRYVVDLLRRREVAFEWRAGGRTLALKPDMAGLSELVVGVYPAKPAAVAVSAATRTVAQGGDVKWAAEVRGARARRLPALFIVEGQVIDSAGKARPEYGGRYAAVAGRLERTVPIAINDPKGVWTLRVRERLTQRESALTFEVK